MKKCFTGCELHEKHILIEIQGLDKTHYSKFEFTFKPTSHVETIEAVAKFMGHEMEKIQLSFQDLLTRYHKGEKHIKLFGEAKLDMNELINFLKNDFFDV